MVRKYNFRSFEDAREFARSLGLNGFEEWRKFIKSDKRPDDIPAMPNNVYYLKWSGWRDFLGPRPTQFRSFEDAREFARSLNFKTTTDWNIWKKSGKRPKNIPSNPHNIYKDEWKGYSDFLGTGNTAAQDIHKNFLSYDDAKKFVHNLGLKSGKQWDDFCNAGKRPANIPRNPQKTYKEHWLGLADWVGTNYINGRKIKFLKFDDAKKFVHNLGLKSGKQWGEFCKAGKRPAKIPQYPENIYKNKGWKGWGDFLGTGTLSPIEMSKNKLPFSEVKKFIQENNIAGVKQWDDFCNAGKRPAKIPKSFVSSYKDEWKGWGDLTGTGRIALQKRKFRSFEDARRFARLLHLHGVEEWKKYRKSGKRPDDIPSVPDGTYKKEWKGWGDFLGTERIANQTRSAEYLPWKEAKPIYQRLAKEYNLSGRRYEWFKFARKHKKLLSELKIPATPSEVYTKERVWRKMKDE
jgi:hypothetical protein